MILVVHHSMQVTCWQNNYDAASRRCLGYGSYGNQRNSTDRFFDTMTRATMPSDGEASELMSSCMIAQKKQECVPGCVCMVMQCMPCIVCLI